MLEFQLTPEDYIEALQTHGQWTRGHWLRVVLIVVAGAAFVAYQSQDDPLWLWLVMFGVYAGIFLLVFALTRYVFLPWQGRKIFAQTKALQRPYHWT